MLRRLRIAMGLALAAPALASALTGCASATESSQAVPAAEPARTSGPTSPATQESDSASVRTVRITITGRRIDPPPDRIQLPVGATIRLVVTSDRANQVHVHGFDIERELRPGRAETLTLTGREPGVYEVELHDPALQITRLVVR